MKLRDAITTALVFTAVSYAGISLAQPLAPRPTPPPVTTASAPVAPPPAQQSIHGCVETIPTGSHRPILEESFPSRGKSGYVATLTVKVHHGKGETVLPRGLDLANGADAKRLLKEAGFVVPDQDGGAAARLTDAPVDPAHPDTVVTILEIPLLALPEKPGRAMLTLPPLPVAVARANGGIISTCTQVHTIIVEDPIASADNPRPKPNAPPRLQREEWVALETTLEILAATLVAAILLGYFFYRWNKRPRPVPPPPPPRPAWEVALERLDEIRHAGLLDNQRYDEYFDRVSDTIRLYLGHRYDFDGLESTTDEVLTALRRAAPSGQIQDDIAAFCKECDLVKFANMTPNVEDCSRALEAGEQIVKRTMLIHAPPVAPQPILSPLNPENISRSGEPPQNPPPPPPVEPPQ
ncbi:MAG: hypothetical protein ABI461_15120 [Polyangiaceae bacterium]